MDAFEVPADRISPVGKRTLLIALLSVALLLRVIPWLAGLPLHHDEALYGTWARAIADGSDPLLLTPWVDKPPLVLYLLALSIKWFGTSELALRLPGMAASILTVWATFGLARAAVAARVGQRGAWVAATLMALSPFAILFGPTAFTDGWLTLFLVAAAWAALAGRPGRAGVLLGLACASKQQGVLGIPLVIALVVTDGLYHKDTKEHKGHKVKRVLGGLGLAALGFALVFGAVTYWDSLRWHNRPSYWDQSLRTYGGVVLAPLAEWPERAGEWAQQAGYWFGAWPVTLALIMVAFAGFCARPFVAPKMEFTRVTGMWRKLATCATHGQLRPALVCFAYLGGYLFVHLAFTFQPWDRYMLPVLPLVCVLIGQGLVAGWDALCLAKHVAVRRGAAAALSAVLLFAASFGLTASIPVGSDIGAYRGVAEAARFLAAEPLGATVYYDRIGWHLGYYLYGAPITRSWYDSPQKLASEAARVAAERHDAPQWLVLPAAQEAQQPALARALAARGFIARPAYEVAAEDGARELTLYRLEPAALAVSGPDRNR